MTPVVAQTEIFGVSTEIAVAVLSGPLMAFGVQRLAKRADERDNRAAALDARDAMLWQRMTDALAQREQEAARFQELLREKEAQIDHLRSEVDDLRGLIEDLRAQLEGGAR